MLDRPVVDGFLYSCSQLYLPLSYRASALAQMETLRKARGYRARWYLAPEDLDTPIPAYGQLEYQIRVEPGSYVWGLSFTGISSGESRAGDNIRVQITDACTETPFFSDYVRASTLETKEVTNVLDMSTTNVPRSPVLINPRLVGQPGMLDVEIYNSASVDLTVQVVIFVAEPMVPPEQIVQALRDMGVTA